MPLLTELEGVMPGKVRAGKWSRGEGRPVQGCHIELATTE